AQQDVAEDLRGANLVLLDHVDGLFHRLGGEDLSLAEDRQELLEQEGNLLGVTLLPRDGDLVAPHQDLGGERSFDQTEQLVALAEQRHHGLAPGDEDLDLGGRLGGHQPGGHLIPRPPSRWKWRWGTLCPASGPTFVTSRQPEPSIPSDLAMCAAVRKISTSMSAWASPRAAAESMCSRGINKTWVGALGFASRKA